MSKATVLTLVSDLALDQENATECGIIYDEIVRELGFLEVLTGTEDVNISSGTATYSVSSTNIQSLEYHNNNGYLSQSNGKGLGSLFGANWRQRRGTPLTVSVDTETEGTFRLVPIPDFDDVVTIIRTEYREDVPTWLELPIAFEILSREFSRESDHQDIVFSQTCSMFSGILFQMAGINFNTQKGAQ